MKIDIKALWMIVEKSTKKVLFPTHSFVRKSGAWSYLSGKNNGIKIRQLKSMYDVKSVYDIIHNNA